MPSGFVHEVHTLVVLGRSYPNIHRRKDAPARRRPGMAHRRFRHGWYQACGRLWDIDGSVSGPAMQRLARVRRCLGAEKVDEYIASLAHEQLDAIWDYPELSREERRITRKYWESVHVWLVLNPDVLRTWAGVDVIAGRIHRVIDGVEIWEEDPEVTIDYARLLHRARLLARVDSRIAFMLARYGDHLAA